MPAEEFPEGAVAFVLIYARATSFW
jgi:hypothetical protein